jgi:hydroxysqualene dehydroxylase
MRGLSSRSPDVIVIGGGFAGLAAATGLADEGARVLLLEARPYLGGRARSFVDPETGSVVDNGQHLFMGCYRETLRFLDRLGSLDRLHLQPRLNVPFLDPGGRATVFSLPPLPFFSWSVAAGLLRFPGLAWSERVGLLRVAREVRRRARARPAEDALDDQSVARWLASLGQGAAACDRLWKPLAVATLNEDPERAAASMLLPVLREVLLGGAAAARLGVPRVGLSDLYVEPAAHFLRARGAEIRLRAQVRQVSVEGGRSSGVLLPDGERIAAAHVIAAVPPDDLLEMLPPVVAGDPVFAGCARLETSPIVSVYLWFGSEIIDLPFAGLIGGEWHWLFNRRAFTGRDSVGHGVTLVCSAARSFVGASREALERRALQDLHRFVPASRRAVLRHSLVIKEKRAAMAPLRGSQALRPPTRTPVPGFHLAGDWVRTGLPATIESAVISGHACARQVLGRAETQAGPSK